MGNQFWNKEKTKPSFETLHTIAKSVDFVLIGGWAVYYYVKQQESLDVDIVINYESVDFFRKFGINQYKNMNIKYSIINGIYVDLFVSEFSDKELPIPTSEILKNYVVVDGIKVVDRNMLILLKLWGYFRSEEVKVRKDIIDVITLLFYGDIDLKKVGSLIKTYKIEKRRSINVLLEYLDKGETLIEFIGIDKNEYSKEKKKYKEELKELFSD
jgi:hypothetical protein